MAAIARSRPGGETLTLVPVRIGTRANAVLALGARGVDPGTADAIAASWPSPSNDRVPERTAGRSRGTRARGPVRRRCSRRWDTTCGLRSPPFAWRWATCRIPARRRPATCTGAPGRRPGGHLSRLLQESSTWRASSEAVRPERECGFSDDGRTISEAIHANNTSYVALGANGSGRCGPHRRRHARRPSENVPDPPESTKAKGASVSDPHLPGPAECSCRSRVRQTLRSRRSRSARTRSPESCSDTAASRPRTFRKAFVDWEMLRQLEPGGTTTPLVSSVGLCRRGEREPLSRVRALRSFASYERDRFTSRKRNRTIQ